jgi:hypothetical protein
MSRDQLARMPGQLFAYNYFRINYAPWFIGVVAFHQHRREFIMPRAGNSIYDVPTPSRSIPSENKEHV